MAASKGYITLILNNNIWFCFQMPWSNILHDKKFKNLGPNIMQTISEKLCALFMAQAPEEAFKCFPSEFPPWPDKLYGTNLHFLLRLSLEGQDILDRGDTLIKSFEFTSEQVQELAVIVCRSIPQSIEAEAFSLEATLEVQKLATLALAISSYHQQKVEASKKVIFSYPAERASIVESINRLVQRGDFNGLLDYFPHAASLLWDEGETDVPEESEKFPSLLRKRMADRLGEEIGGNNSHLQFISLFQWLGTPPVLEDLEIRSVSARSDIVRNGKVLQAIEAIVFQLEEIFQPNAPKNPRNVINISRFLTSVGAVPRNP